MQKCKHCKKYTKGYYRCEITGQILSFQCSGFKKKPNTYYYGYYPTQCKYFELCLIDRFFDWLEDKT